MEEERNAADGDDDEDDDYDNGDERIWPSFQGGQKSAFEYENHQSHFWNDCNNHCGFTLVKNMACFAFRDTRQRC